LNSQEMIEYNELLYVSEGFSVKEELLKCHHDNFLIKHFDANKISELLNHKYYWKSMIKNVKKYINTCDICQKVKMKHHLSYDELKSLSQFTNFWKEITINFITDLFFLFFIKCMQSMTMTLSRRCVCATLHVI